MFKIFRKVRFYLIEQSKTKQYLLYALGEIILVVFGILLALQINEWNQDRKDKLEEVVILRNLHSEYVQNKTSLEEQKGILLQSQNSSEILMSLMGKKESEIKQYNLDSLIFWTIEYYPFNPSDNVFSDLLQSGRLQLIGDDTLRNTLFEWSRDLNNYRNTFKEYQQFLEETVLPYLIDHMALKNADRYGPLAWKKPSFFESNPHEMLQDRTYENILDNHLYHASLVQEHFMVLEKIIDTIIERTN